MSRRRKAPADHPSSLVTTPEWRQAAKEALAEEERRYTDLCGPVVVTKPEPPAVPDLADALREQVEAMQSTDGLSIMFGWLVHEVGEHTCGGYGPESNYMHEPGCGFEPILDLSKMEGWPGDERDALAEWRDYSEAEIDSLKAKLDALTDERDSLSWQVEALRAERDAAVRFRRSTQ